MAVQVPSEVRHTGYPRAGVANSWDLPNMDIGNQTPALYKSRLFYTALLSLSTPKHGEGPLTIYPQSKLNPALCTLSSHLAHPRRTMADSCLLLTSRALSSLFPRPLLFGVARECEDSTLGPASWPYPRPSVPVPCSDDINSGEVPCAPLALSAPGC